MVTFALVGNAAEPGARIEDEEWERPWDDRPRVQLDVADGEKLGSLVERALREFGVSLSEGTVPAHVVDLGLYQDAETRARRSEFTLLDDHGRVVWSAHDLRLIPYAQLVESAEAGALPGDPQRLYLILREPIGNGLGVDWAALLEVLSIIDEIAIRVAASIGAYATIHKAVTVVRERIQSGRQALDRNVHRMDQQGAWPYSLGQFLYQRDSWDSAELAGFLGCTPADTEGILAVFGFAYEEHDGLWHRDLDEAANLLAEAVDEALTSRDVLLSDSDRQLFETRIEELLSTGQRPSEAPYGAEFEAEMAEMERQGQRYDLIDGIQVLISELVRPPQPAEAESGWSEANRLEIARLFAALRGRLLNPTPLDQSEKTPSLRSTFERRGIDPDHPLSEAAETIIVAVWEREL